VLGFSSVDYTAIDMASAQLGAVSVPLQTNAAIAQLHAVAATERYAWWKNRPSALPTDNSAPVAPGRGDHCGGYRVGVPRSGCLGYSNPSLLQVP
jgi:hypothetical protein